VVVILFIDDAAFRVSYVYIEFFYIVYTNLFFRTMFLLPLCRFFVPHPSCWSLLDIFEGDWIFYSIPLRNNQVLTFTYTVYWRTFQLACFQISLKYSSQFLFQTENICRIAFSKLLLTDFCMQAFLIGMSDLIVYCCTVSKKFIHHQMTILCNHVIFTHTWFLVVFFMEKFKNHCFILGANVKARKNSISGLYRKMICLQTMYTSM